MTKPSFHSALLELRTATDDILTNVHFVEAADKLRPRVGKYLAWNILGNEDMALVKDFMSCRCDAGPAYEGLFVRLAASFESFIRRVVRDAVQAINATHPKYEAVVETLRVRNRHCVGRTLSTVYEPLDYLQIDFDALCSEIGTCFPGATEVRLSSEAFSACVGRLSPKSIEAAFGLLGTVLQWDYVAKQPELMEALKQTKTRDAAKATQDSLGEIQKRRNGYAHNSIGGVRLSAENVRDSAAFLIALSMALVKLLETSIWDLHLKGGR